MQICIISLCLQLSESEAEMILIRSTRTWQCVSMEIFQMRTVVARWGIAHKLFAHASRWTNVGGSFS